jgi:hypothetical protein
MLSTGAPPDITDTNVADLSSLVTEFRFTRMLEQIKAHSHKFPVPQLIISHGEDVHHLLANQPGTISPSRDQAIMNFTCSLRELVGDGSPEVGQTSRFLMGHQPPMSPTMRSETVQNSKFQEEIEVLTTESQNLKKETERLQTVLRTTVTENRKTKKDNQTFLTVKEELALTNTKFTADEKVSEDLTSHW